jgi:ASC-1-like (ASCH) protein
MKKQLITAKTLLFPKDSRWLRAIAAGTKTVEGRKGTPHTGKYASWEVGDTIIMRERVSDKDIAAGKEPLVVRAEIAAIRHHPDLISYLGKEGIDNVLPGIKTLADAAAIYHEFYTEDSIRAAGGMLAIEIKLVK